MPLRWFSVTEAEAKVRRALRIPPAKKVAVRHANFAKISNQKFYVRFKGHDLLATFFADHQIARKESLILDYLNDITSEARKIGFVPPKKLYLKNGLLIRERVGGETMRWESASDDVLAGLAQLLLLFQKTTPCPELREFRLHYSQMRDRARRQIPQAREAFSPFRGSGGAFDELGRVLDRDWSQKLRRQPKGFVHGDVQPQNILLQNSKMALIDFDRGGYFYPLFDAASFAVQFSHASLLEQYHQEQPDRLEIRRRREVFLKEYRTGFRQLGEVWDEELFRLFKLLIIFNGLAFSTAGFRKKVTRGAKHFLFGLFRQELKHLSV